MAIYHRVFQIRIHIFYYLEVDFNFFISSSASFHPVTLIKLTWLIFWFHGWSNKMTFISFSAHLRAVSGASSSNTGIFSSLHISAFVALCPLWKSPALIIFIVLLIWCFTRFSALFLNLLGLEVIIKSSLLEERFVIASSAPSIGLTSSRLCVSCEIHQHFLWLPLWFLLRGATISILENPLFYTAFRFFYDKK